MLSELVKKLTNKYLLNDESSVEFKNYQLY